MVKQLSPARASAFPASAAPDPGVPSERPDALAAEHTPLRLFLLIIGILMIPGTFSVAGSVLSPYRVALLIAFPFLVRRWLTITGGRPAMADLLMLMGGLWLILALVMNHGLGVLPRGAIMFVEMSGGYLIGRTLIRSAADYRTFFRAFTWAFVVLAPLLVIEALTGFNLLRKLADIVMSIPGRQSNLGQRFGLTRAQGPFEHPILLGLVASLAVTNVFYIYRRQFAKSVGLAGFFFMMVFTSVSSGPLLSVFCQGVLTAWDRMLSVLKIRWLILGYLAALAFLLLRISADFNLLGFVLDNFAYSQVSAEGRLIVFDYGTMEVAQHPIFGIGLNDWTRPWWRAGRSSFDNFWLMLAMRFGLPTFVFLALVWVVSFIRITSQTTLTEEESDYRLGYLFTMVGLVITLGTVYIWNATAVFVWIYIGAGAWFYQNRTLQDDTAVRRRRAAQAKAFSGATPVAVRSGAKPEINLFSDLSPRTGRVSE
jgi:hypothetical protein